MPKAIALHPLCALFPRLADAEFAAFKADIAANGLNQPIVIYRGQILDGGNRYRACVELGIKPATVDYTGTDPMGFVFSANARRRHLTPGQYAAIVASAQNWELAQAQGGDGSNQHSSKAATLPVCSNQPAGATDSLSTVADRAAQSGASERTQRMADKVAKVAPELAKQVAHGEISLPQAVRQVEKKLELAQKSAPAPDPEPENPLADLAADYEREVAENRELQKRVAVLTTSDQVAALNEWITRYHSLEGRLNQALVTGNEAQREAMRKGKVLSQIRAFLGVERDAEILPKLKGGA